MLCKDKACLVHETRNVGTRRALSVKHNTSNTKTKKRELCYNI